MAPEWLPNGSRVKEQKWNLQASNALTRANPWGEALLLFERVPSCGNCLSGCFVHWQQRELAAAQGTQSSEMALVESQQASGAIAAGQYDDTQVRESGIEVVILAFQADHHAVLIGFKATDREPPGAQVVKKRQPRGSTQTTSQEVIDLGGDRSRNDQLPGFVS